MALRLPIRAQLLLLGLALAVPAALLFAWHAADAAKEARSDAYAQVRLLARSAAAQLDDALADYDEMLGRVAGRPLVRALDPRHCDPIIAEFIQMHPEFLSLGVRDASGRVVCSYLPGAQRVERAAGLAWFEEGLRTAGLSAGDAFNDRPGRRWTSVLTYPVRNDKGNVSGLLGLPVDLERVQERLFRSTPKGTLVAVADRRRHVLMRSADAPAWIGKPLPAALLDATRSSAGGVLEADGDDGVRRLHAVATVPRSGWLVVAGVPEDELLAAFRQERNELVAIGIAMLAGVLALAWWTGATFARPIAALAETAARVAAGDASARAAVAGPAELEEVARQFNRMLDVRDRMAEERAALVGHFGSLARLARDVILLVDPHGRIVEANDAAVAAYGYPAGELRGMDLRRLHVDDAQGDFDRHWSASARPGGTLFEAEHRRRDGSTFPVEVSSSVVDIEGRPYRQSFVRDITDRRAAEAQLRRATTAYATLSETNQAIVRMTGEAEMIQRVCRIAVEFGGYLGAWIGFVDAATGEVRPAASHGPIAGYVSRLRLSVDPTRPEGQGPAGIALRAGLPRYCDDFLADPETAPWHGLAREFGIRAFVALPLRRAGAVAGVLALYSAEAGAFDANTRSLLEEMAADVSFALDNFDREAALAEWAGRYEATVKASGQILLDRDIATGAMTLGGDVERILGYREGELAGGLARWTAIVHADDRERFAAEMERAVRERRPFHLQYRVRRKDDSTLVVQDDGYFARDASGDVARMVGFVADITERKLAEDRIRSQLEELRRWHSAMLGREMRVLQLKREVNEALAAAGSAPRYESPHAAHAEEAHA